ncbi:alpha/beta hydrolase [Nocardioides panacisoli]|uniref:Alpha/beta hydrolase n=1 Tax=Nocardioides panacisoli TaxID=627624 RepID=A0ABP7IVC7_9ACTN
MDLRTSIEAITLKTLMGLPERVQRLLAGRTVDIDGQRLDTDVQLMLRLQQVARVKGSEELPLAEGRAQMVRTAGLVRGHQPVGAVRDLEVAGLPARHYLPTGLADGPGPVLLFFHGGGFLYGDLDSHDGPCRVLAEQSGVPVLSVAYRLGPEAAFPTAFDDAEAAHRWVVDHAEELGVDPQRIAVGGDSAGGNLAAWVAIAAARGGVPLAWQLLVYPCTFPERDTASLRLFGEGLYLTREFIDTANSVYLPTELERKDERVALLGAELPAGLAPAYVVTAGFDPLRDEGEQYAARLEAEGHAVEVERRPGQIHGFLNIVGVGRSSRAAVDRIAERLGDALA